ncbi:MAG: hypothetical protein WC249_01870 [Patescibacteria group bacterium]|jgi:hypothetical protein
MAIIQIIYLFGVFFIFGVILSKIQTATQKNYSNSVGWRGILWTAWLGTPVHEYSHAFFALLFRHKITDIVLFSPDVNTGELGHVNHSYNPRNFYQNLGNFFIGLAPLIFGPLLLVGLLYVLVPQGQEIFYSLAGNLNSFSSVLTGIQKFLLSLFSLGNFKSYSFWIFLYISFCIASHLAPSKADRQGAWRGGAVILSFLLFLNILGLWLHWEVTEYVVNFSHFFAGLIVVYIYALIISLIHFLFSYLILWPWRRKY